MRPLIVISMITCTIGACGDTVPPPGVEFTVDAARYAPGDSAQLQLVNFTTDAFRIAE